MRVRGRPPPFPLAGQRGTERESEVNEILEFCRQMLPVRKEALWGTATGAAGVVSEYFFGVWNVTLEALVWAMVIDYLTGVLAAYINPQLMLDSRTGFRGICKKILTLLLVSLAHFVDNATGQQIVCTAVVWFFLGNEGLSILENAAKAGVPVPGKLRQTLKQLSVEKTERKENLK